MRRVSLFLSLILVALFVKGQSEAVQLDRGTFHLMGELLIPENVTKPDVVLFISGSGPTDRDGNQKNMMNNSILQLAVGLQSNGIASLRYDKRGIGASVMRSTNERLMTIDSLVGDAADWIEKLKKSGRFNRVVVAGHSEGSLIGLLAVLKVGADGFISISGAGRRATDLLMEQLSKQPAKAKKYYKSAFDTLSHGDTLKVVDPWFYTLLRPSVQPYLISWFRYDPAQLMGAIKVPSLIIQGLNDLQIKQTDAELLAAANIKSTLWLIPGMNHVLKMTEASDINGQMPSYTTPDSPINSELVPGMKRFIVGLPTKE